MKLVCERENLDHALSLVIGRAKTNKTIPVLCHVLIVADKRGGVTLSTTDLDAASTATFPAVVRGEGSALVEADRLTRLVGNFPDGGQVSIEAGDSVATVKCGRSTYRLAMLPAIDFPAMPEPTNPVKFSLDASIVKRLFHATQEAVERSGRHYLEGGYLHPIEGSKACVVSTNGHLLLQVWSDGAKGEIPAGVIVPRTTMTEITKIAVGNVEFECGPDLIRVRAGACTYTSKLIEGTYPDYQRVIPQESAAVGSILVDRDDLIAALGRLNLLNAGTTGVRFDWARDGDLQLSIKGEGAGEESVPAEIDADSFGGIGFAPHLMLSALKEFQGETVRLFVTDTGSAARIVGGEPGDLTAVVMPMKVSA